MKIALSIQYDGSQFSGWQRQKHAVRTVQQTLEKSLSKVADSPITVACAGRTDTGVHGMAQVVHIETDVQRDMKAWVYGGNRFLDYDVSISWAKAVPDDFHARFSAQARQYRYVICNTPIRPAAMRQYVSWNYRPLDAGRMQEAAEYLTGEHDFSSYRAAGCQAKTATREVRSLTVRRFGSMVVVDICANAFLQHMVRNIVGVLMKIGAGEREPAWAKEVLAFRDRTKGGVTAPPYGLYFVGVEYPEKYSLPEQSVDEFLFPLPLAPDSG
ncbi:MAG: tRNA pseudouridine(38-40) synthase TruA [Gammaproteobacteria bacterium]|nr:tRNA pseudouridine(38-40) synthase TruA [Gammaproteobacteria bacterium]